MMSGRTVKRYREGNITAAFGTDLLLQGITAVPNLLLRLYRHLDITDEEMILLIQLLRLQIEEKNLLPSASALAECTSQDVTRVQQNLNRLLEKEVLAVTEYYDESKDQILSGYDFEPLLEKLSEIWASIRVREIERTRCLLEKRTRLEANSPEFALIIKAFEQEFGRPVSPMEVEQIRQWIEELNPTLVLEALRRAVLRGKHNFKYIDSIILEWKKNNLRTLEEINAYDAQFKKRRSVKNTTPKVDERKKALLKTLYLS
jgi:DNA replication protein